MRESDAAVTGRGKQGGFSKEKTTTLEGYYRSGDHECFCFDRLDGPDAYPNFEFHEIQQQLDMEDKNRVYPDELLPEGCTYGTWEIIVRFTPLETP